uniref:Uncharacterized protein n=1 Tax=Panagrolaimus sp. JU765 TaxID=591449 RepID=A0AC34QJH1_9BILA
MPSGNGQEIFKHSREAIEHLAETKGGKYESMKNAINSRSAHENTESGIPTDDASKPIDTATCNPQQAQQPGHQQQQQQRGQRC